MTSQALKALFKEEATDLIEQFGVLVETMASSTATDHREIIAEILRIVHNLKGAARTLGHNGLERLSHSIEEDLEPLKRSASIPEQYRLQLEGAARGLQMLVDDIHVETATDDSMLDNETVAESTQDLALFNRSSIRVDSRRFDELMGYSGDLMMSRARMEERQHRLRELADKLERRHAGAQWGEENGIGEAIREMRQMIQSDSRDLIDFGYLTDQITETMKRLRMVPLRVAEREWREVIHKASVALGKEIEVAIHTGDVQIDKRVLDQLRDPMMHLLRNAVDHGLELPDERQAAGKSAAGRLEIDASLKGATVELVIRDDGRGIHREELRRAAVKFGLVEPRQLSLLADETLFDFLFHPGLSTAQTVTDMSGRGVGLDVVRSRIESLGGRVTVSSPVGAKGTTFVLTVPLSVLSTVGLLVTSGDTAFALPLEYIQRTAQINDANLGKLDGEWVLRQKDADPIRLIQLSTLMGEQVATSKLPDKVVVLCRSNMLLGILVDSIVDQYEFVTQPLPWNLEQISGVSGGSLRPDGSVVVVLDVPFLFEKASIISDVQGRRNDGKEKGRFAKRVLVVDDSLAARTMEKDFLLSAGYEVSLAEDGEAAWQRLHEQAFDLLVSDVDMPKVNGLDLTRRVRSSDKFQDLPVILVTSLNSADARTAGAEAGADEYVVKGTFDQKALLEVVSRYL